MNSNNPPKLSIDKYMMHIALTVKMRARCLRRQVGAVLAREGHIVSTGYNGTPHNIPNCDQGGCIRCSDTKTYPHGVGYDMCICVHAEQNTLLSAARFGISVEGTILYTTTKPCFGCIKELLQARIIGVIYLHEWVSLDSQHKEDYKTIVEHFPKGLKQINFQEAL